MPGNGIHSGTASDPASGLEPEAKCWQTLSGSSPAVVSAKEAAAPAATNSSSSSTVSRSGYRLAAAARTPCLPSTFTSPAPASTIAPKAARSANRASRPPATTAFFAL